MHSKRDGQSDPGEPAGSAAESVNVSLVHGVCNTGRSPIDAMARL